LTPAIDTMFALQSAGVSLIEAGATPQFSFEAAAVPTHA